MAWACGVTWGALSSGAFWVWNAETLRFANRLNTGHKRMGVWGSQARAIKSMNFLFTRLERGGRDYWGSWVFSFGHVQWVVTVTPIGEVLELTVV